MRPKRARVGGGRRAGAASGAGRSARAGLCHLPCQSSNSNESMSSQGTACSSAAGAGGGGVSLEPVHVVCRLRPTPASVAQCIEHLDDNTLQLTPPPDSQAFRNGTAKQQCYRFHTILAGTSQREVFDSVARDLVRDLLSGQNGLLFAYGVTGSGKTHTMMGSGSGAEAGIIPRALDMVFASIGNVQARRKVFRPDAQCLFQVRSEADAMLERQRELMAAAATPKTPSKRYGFSTPSTASKRLAVATPAVDAAVSGGVQQQPTSLQQTDVIDEDSAYAVFLSYIEIYNNCVYDLLEEIPAEYMKRELRARQIREDTANNRVWVQDVNEVETSSVADALDVLKRGQRRRKVAHTNLNSESSRSHSVLNIRVVQAPLDARGEEVLGDVNAITVGQLSLVDLAGSERANRTKNQGDTLREAGSINKSLMALRVYIDARRSQQRAAAIAAATGSAVRSGTTVLPNARNDKLTHLFKNYFDGEGRIKMIVCVNPRAEEYDETINVMQFAELTQEVTVTRHEDKLNTAVGLTPGRRKANQLWREAGALEPGAAVSDVDLDVVYCLSDQWPSLYMNADVQQRTIECLRRFLQRRSLTRAKLQTDMDDKLRVFRERLVRVEMEAAGLRSENSSLQQNNSVQRRRIDDLQRRLADSTARHDSLTRQLNDAGSQQRQLHEQLDEKTYRLNQQLLDQNRLRAGIEQQMERQKERLISNAQRLRSDRHAMKQELRAREDKLRALRSIINTDSGGGGGGSDRFVKPPLPPPPSASAAADPRHGQHDLPPPPRVTRSTHARADSDTALSATPQPKRPPPMTTRRRSKSIDAENWLDHRPGHVLQMATLFQPKMRKRKSVSKLEAKDVVNNKTSKYVLTHQDVDSAGEVETHMVKGDILPTVGGGRAVVFNDMETLRLSTPGVATVGDDAATCRLDRQLVEKRCHTGIEGHTTDAGRRRKT